MDTVLRMGTTLGVALVALGIQTFVDSVESTWNRAQRLRLSLLASPSDAYSTYCQEPENDGKAASFCSASIMRKTRSGAWVALCDLPFTKASRWYEIQLECKFPYGPLPEVTAKTRIWR